MIVDCNDFWAILYYGKCQNQYCSRIDTFEKESVGCGGGKKPLVVDSSWSKSCIFALLDWSGSLLLPTTPRRTCLSPFFPTSSLHIDYSDCRVLFVKCFVICTSRKVTIHCTSKVEHPFIGIMQITLHSCCARQRLSKHLASSHGKNQIFQLSSYLSMSETKSSETFWLWNMHCCYCSIVPILLILFFHFFFGSGVFSSISSKHGCLDFCYEIISYRLTFSRCWCLADLSHTECL